MYQPAAPASARIAIVKTAPRKGFAARYRRTRVPWVADHVSHLGACHCHRPNSAANSDKSVRFRNEPAAPIPEPTAEAARFSAGQNARNVVIGSRLGMEC